MIIVIDSWAWIEYFSGSSSGRIVRDYLAKYPVVTPNIVLLELASKYIREGFSESDIRRRLLFVLKRSELVEFDYDLSVEAAKCLIELREHAKKLGMKKKPGIADGLILAIARRVGGKILTGDPHFKNLSEVIFIKE